MNKEQQAYQHAKDWWYVFAGIFIGAIPAFILGFELTRQGERRMNLEAIWCQKDYDIPIKIIAYLGNRNGEHWWLVENSEGRTGIPESQIAFRREENER